MCRTGSPTAFHSCHSSSSPAITPAHCAQLLLLLLLVLLLLVLVLLVLLSHITHASLYPYLCA
jgi:hypothetical protein